MVRWRLNPACRKSAAVALPVNAFQRHDLYPARPGVVVGWSTGGPLTHAACTGHWPEFMMAVYGWMRCLEDESRFYGDDAEMIVKTAGHVDHGKTTLLRAITGVNADRLPEEKKTRDGYRSGLRLWLQPDGRVLELYRCAGHEEFTLTCWRA